MPFQNITSLTIIFSTIRTPQAAILNASFLVNCEDRYILFPFAKAKPVISLKGEERGSKRYSVRKTKIPNRMGFHSQSFHVGDTEVELRKKGRNISLPQVTPIIFI